MCDQSANIKTLMRVKIVDKLSTGHPAVDVAVCCALPYAANRATAAAKAVWYFVQHQLGKRHHHYERSIAQTVLNNWRSDAACHNEMLQTAILTYISSQPDVTRAFQVSS